MKRKAFIIGLAALALSLGSIGIIGGVSLGFDDSLIATKAVASTTGDTLEFSGKCGGSGTSTNGVTWKVTSDATESTFEKERGIHYGTSSAEVKTLTLTSAAYDRKISKVTVYAAHAGSAAADVSVTVGGNAFGDSVTLASENTKSTPCVFEGNALGVVVVTVGRSEAKKAAALYVKSIEIEFLNEDPTISIDGESDVTVKKGGSKDVKIKVENLPENGDISVATSDSNVATATLSESKDAVTINGVAVGETSYTVSMKDANGKVVSFCGGNIAVSAGVTSLSISSDFNSEDILKVGTSHKIELTVDPSDAEVAWKVSDENAASISSDGTLSILQKVDGLVTVTVTSVADSAFTSSLSFYIDNEFSVSDLVSQGGSTAPNGLISGSTQVVTHGTVTAIDGTSIYIQDGEAGLLVYHGGNAFKDQFVIGDGVKVSGTYKIENGVTKLTSPKLIEKGDTYKESVTSLELTSADMVSKNTNRFVSAASTLASHSSSLSEASKAVSISFTLNDEAKTPYVLYIASDYFEKALSQFGDVESGIAYDIKGIYSFYNNITQEIVFVEGCSYYNTALTDFIATYIAPYSGDAKEGETCASKYANASAALGKLTEASQNTFKTALAYEEAYSVYSYWESHQTSANGAKLIAGHQTTDWANIAVIASITLIAAGASVYLIRNRKKQDR